MSPAAPSVQLSPLPALRGVLLGIVLSLSVLSGCSGFSSEEKPLPDTTFTRVLTELHLVMIRKSQSAPSPPGLRDSIFQHYEVDSSDFQATLRYYSRHPKAFESLYQTVIDTLQAQQYPRGSRAIPKGAPDSLDQLQRGGSSQ